MTPVKKTSVQRTLQQSRDNSYLSGGNAAYIEDLYDQYLKNPESVNEQWRNYFASLGPNRDVSHYDVQEILKKYARQPANAGIPVPPKQEAVDALISAFRRFGHYQAKSNPLNHDELKEDRLNLSYHQLTQSDFTHSFLTRGLLKQETATLSEIYQTLLKTYCGSIGVEYSFISNEAEREWIRQYVEHKIPAWKWDAETKRAALKKVMAAADLEKYLDVKYPGQKRFSVEGNDSVIPMLDRMTQRLTYPEMTEIVIGMAHRGRLNVLINIMGQAPRELFQEFEGKKEFGSTSGDVKYHIGYSSDVETTVGPVHLSLAFNPSHLEFVNPVIMGSVRARQERSKAAAKRHYAMPIMIHGDASFSGQGVVMEIFSMSQTRAYNVGGSIHIILNNQVGFTTSDPRDARSSHYCSDLGKMIDAPIFHVNADDVEAAVMIGQLALDYRKQFQKDIVIDLIGYRRHGHQEVDEPRATQPVMYQKIDNHPSVKEIYSKKLIEEGVCTAEEVTQWTDEYVRCLDEGRVVMPLAETGLAQQYAGNWAPYLDQSWQTQVDTTVDEKMITELGKKLTALPANFTLQRNVKMTHDARKKMAAGEVPIDWGYAETMAYATLLTQGHPVRFSGEDVRRGTFFHRQASILDQNTGESFTPLLHLSDKQASLQIYDSLLSETGALGFEYGYSTAEPNALVIWEAQYGDFVNVAQVIIDQFISSTWQKWHRLSGLVMLLPHGDEGSGPEHSSARLERFLQLCAEENMQVCTPTTPAQIFHLLRRQALRPYRKPLIIMSPKSMLRNKLAVSSLQDLSHGQLQLVIPETDKIDSKKVTRVIVCAGKLYYELLEKRRENKIDNIALIRIEQLYPFPKLELIEALSPYSAAKEFVWCQDEPQNQGSWYMIRHLLAECIPAKMEWTYVGKKAMAAPAVGYMALFKKLQNELIEQALKLK